MLGFTRIFVDLIRGRRTRGSYQVSVLQERKSDYENHKNPTASAVGEVRCEVITHEKSELKTDDEGAEA